MSSVVVLHVSDLHFGIENAPTAGNKYVRLRQQEMLTSLIDSIAEVVKDDPDWKPDIIAVSGDIAWTGEADEYRLYKEKFAVPFAKVLSIPQDHIITCPGNHDIIRSRVKNLNRPFPNQKDPDVEDLDREQLNNQASHFEGYINELYNGDASKLCQVISFPEWPWVSFLTLNSAWDCRNNEDEGRLRVGLPLLEHLINQVPDKNYVITLFHHPHTETEDYIEEFDNVIRRKVLTTKKRTWLHISEREPDCSGGRCFSSYVEQKSTFILNGHIHKESEPQKLSKSIQLISGTVYSNDTPKYHCRLLRLSNNAEPCYRDLRHTIGGSNDKWEITNTKSFQFEHVAIIISRKEEQREKDRQFGLRLREAAAQFERDKNLSKYRQAVADVTNELMNEAIIPTNKSTKEYEDTSKKENSLEHTDVLKLKNEGGT